MLRVEQLTVYYGESRILKEVHLEVPDGAVTCLMGRNGVGKTTLLNTIMGLVRPRSGNIFWNQKDITPWAPYERARSGIGYVPQGRGIFPYLTVYENILIGLETVKEKDLSAPEALEDVLSLFPQLKEKGMLSRPAGALSGGQQQILAFARALVGRPRLLLLDEPTEGIQPSIVLEIENLIQSIKEQNITSILLVEQYLEFALRLADCYYVMEKGTIVSEGITNELTHEAVYDHLVV